MSSNPATSKSTTAGPKTNSKVDPKLFQEIRTHALDTKALYGKRDEDFKNYEMMYLAKWAEENSVKFKDVQARIVASPDPRNAVLGAVRLMIANDPIFSVRSYADEKSFDKDQLQKSLARWWQQSGKIADRPIHYDLLLSAILYGETHTAVTPMADLLKRAPANRRERIQRRADMAPCLIENWNPICGYPEFDTFGLSGYYREVETTAGRIQNDFDNLNPSLMGRKPSDKIILSTWYDLDNCAIWVGGDAIYLGQHGLPEIPVSVTLIDGSKLFPKPEDQRQPMLYTLLKTGLWDQQNLALTVLYTMIFALGTTAMFVHTAPPEKPGKKLDINFDNTVGVVELEAGEGFSPVQSKGIIDPAFREGYQLATQKGQESSIYNQALGAPVDRLTTFSEMSLLNQAGRLPLIGPQQMGGQSISKILELALMIVKKDGTSFSKNGINLKPSDIPDDLEVETSLQLHLPQDKLQLANIAAIIKQNGWADDEWIQKEFWQITDHNDMRERMWTQKADETRFMLYLQQQVQEAQKALQAPPPGQPGQPGQPPGQAMMQGPPPEMQQGAGPMMPQPEQMQGGLPPQQGGMIPDQSQGQMMPGGQ